MSSTIGEPTPDEIVQSEIPDLRTVPVTVETPVRVQQPPTPNGVHFQVTFPDAVTPVPVVGADPRRKHLILGAVTDGIWIGTNPQAVAKKQCFRVNTTSYLTVTHREALWAMPDTNAAALLSVVQEQWTN